MHEYVQCFNSISVKIQLEQRDGFLLGFSELFRKFYAAKKYTEVAEKYTEVAEKYTEVAKNVQKSLYSHLQI